MCTARTTAAPRTCRAARVCVGATRPRRRSALRAHSARARALHIYMSCAASRHGCALARTPARVRVPRTAAQRARTHTANTYMCLRVVLFPVHYWLRALTVLLHLS